MPYSEASGEPVSVIGAGVIGLTSALQLARSGRRVRVIADRRPRDTVSAVAAALWEPYEAYPLDTVLRWSWETLAAFTELAENPDTGVYLREGVIVQRGPVPEWRSRIPGSRPADAAELRFGAPAGFAATVPMIVMPVYLDWLQHECSRAGVEFEWRSVTSLDDPAGDVVVAAGLRSGELTGDTGLRPIRGQIVRLANPGLTRWYVDAEHPDGCIYLVPRVDDVICGGTNQPGNTDPNPDPATAAGILARAIELEPSLADVPVLAHAVGLRPGRDAVRIDVTETGGRRVVHCYGHGGAGVTTSWGAARNVADMLTTSA